MSKTLNRLNPTQRNTSFRLERESFLILCEGENTEPAYFNAFRLTTATVRALPVTSGNAMAVARAAIKRRIVETNRGNIYDHYWVVFDKDNTSASDFNAAIELAQAAGFQVAYSNQAFEIWFLLHFNYVSGPMHRSQYASQLSRLLGFHYTKHIDVARLMFRALSEKQEIAISNGLRLEAYYASSSAYRNPAVEESSTTVYQLVEKLRAFK